MNKFLINRATKRIIAATAVFVFSLILTSTWGYFYIEDKTVVEAEAKVANISNGLLDGLNVMMAGGIIGNSEYRKLFFNKFKANPEVVDLRVFRGEGVIRQFGIGIDGEKPVDKMDSSVLSDGTKRILRNREDETIRVVSPYIARESFRGQNCLSCHNVKEGSVNGASSITISTKQIKADNYADMVVFYYVLLFGYMATIVLIIFDRSGNSFHSKIKSALEGNKQEIVEKSYHITDDDSVLELANKHIDCREKERQDEVIKGDELLLHKQRELEYFSALLENVNTTIGGLSEISSASEEITYNHNSINGVIKTASKNIGEIRENFGKIAKDYDTIFNSVNNARSQGKTVVSMQSSLQKAISDLGQLSVNLKTITRKAKLISIKAEIESSKEDEEVDFTGIAAEIQSFTDGLSENNKEGQIISKSAVVEIERLSGFLSQLSKSLNSAHAASESGNSIIGKIERQMDDSVEILARIEAGSEEQVDAAAEISNKNDQIKDKHIAAKKIIKKITSGIRKGFD